MGIAFFLPSGMRIGNPGKICIYCTRKAENAGREAERLPRIIGGGIPEPAARLRGFFRDLAGMEPGLYAASGAYFLFLSLIPLTALACSLLPLTPFTREAVLDQLSAVLPEAMEELLREILEQVYGSGAAAVSLSALLTLWSASKAFLGLIQGLDRIFGGETPGGFLRHRAVSGFCTLALLLAVILSLLIALFRRRLIRFLASVWPPGSGALLSLLRIRFFLAMVALALFFALLYTFLPSRRQRFLRQLPGAMLAALLWMLLTWLFGSSVKGLGGVTLYGSLASAVLALFWVYLCMYLILLGAFFNTRLFFFSSAPQNTG